MLKCADDSPPGQYGSNASGSCSSGVTAAGNLSLAATPSETLPEDLHKQQEAFYNHQVQCNFLAISYGWTVGLHTSCNSCYLALFVAVLPQYADELLESVADCCPGELAR